MTNNVVIGNHIDNASKGVLLATALLTTVVANDMLTVTTPETCNSCTYADQFHYGAEYFPTGPVVVGLSAYSGGDKVHIGGALVSSFTGTVCVSTAADCATTPSNGASPILETIGATGGNKVRFRMQSQSDGTVTLDSTDTGAMILESGSQNWLNLSTHGLGPRSGTLAQVGACGSTVLIPTFVVITDSTTTTWGADIAGTSTNIVLAYCNGVSTHWTVAAKAGS